MGWAAAFGSERLVGGVAADSVADNMLADVEAAAVVDWGKLAVWEEQLEE